MYWKLDVSRCSTGLCVICLLCNVLMNTVRCNSCQFILPFLPETPYTLDDVIILPENQDFVEASLLTTETASLLSTINVTLENDFRLGNVCTIPNSTIESGLQIITQSKVTVVIQLTTGLLHLPPIKDYAKEYHIFTIDDSLETNRERRLFIQSKHPNTLVTLCVRNYEPDKVADKSIPHSHEIFSTPKCTRKNISAFGELLFNNTSMLHGAEITSDRPIGILEGHRTRTHSSSSDRNGRDLNSSETPVTPITWYNIQPYRDRSNQFVLIPSQDRLNLKLWIMSFKSTLVDVFTDDDVIQLVLTANIPSNISVSVKQGTILTITGNNSLFLTCEDSNIIHCKEDIFSVTAVGLDSTTMFNNVSESQDYQWSYIPNGKTERVICPSFINVDFYSSNGTAEYTKKMTVNILNQTLLIGYFKAPNGLYKLSVNNSLRLCNMSEMERSFSKESSTPHQKKHVVSSSPFTPINTPGIDSTVSKNTMGINTPSAGVKSSHRNNTEAETTDSAMIFSTASNIINTLNTKEKLQITSASTSSLPFSSNTTNNETKNSSNSLKLNLNDSISTLQNRSVKANNRRNKKKENALNSDINDRFKAVVDILHTRNGTVNTLISQEKQSNKRNNPAYIYRLDIMDGTDKEDDGKNPLAIIVSLVSALLAVGAIILIYLLKDFFSRRQQLRNTRIRPFISYY